MKAALVAVVLLTGPTAGPVPAAPVSTERSTLGAFVGERADYEVRFLFKSVGTASLSVPAVDTVRGQPAYRIQFTMRAGVNALLYRYSTTDTTRSWVDTSTFATLRFHQDINDNGTIRTRRYEIYPDREVYRDKAEPEQRSVADPLDEFSFLYFVRAQTLQLGAVRSWDRYFKPASNPVVLKVLRADTIEAAGRRWPTIVVQPVIKTSPMFADGEAQVWVSDDPMHVIVQINTKLRFGSITMRLRSYRPPNGAR